MLTPQDREWVGAIVKVAASETLTASRDLLYTALEAHQKSCIWVIRGKAWVVGVAVGGLLAGAGLGAALSKLGSIWSGG